MKKMWKTAGKDERTFANEAELADRARFSTFLALVGGMLVAPVFLLVVYEDHFTTNYKDVDLWIPATSSVMAAYLLYRLLGWASLAAGIVNGWGIAAFWAGVHLGPLLGVIVFIVAVLGAAGFLRGGLKRRRKRHQNKQVKVFD